MLPDEVRKAVEAIERSLCANYLPGAPVLNQWEAVRAHLLAREAEVERLRTMLAGRGEDYSHLCKRCGNPYTPKPDESEDCPECGFDGITAHLSENSRG